MYDLCSIPGSGTNYLRYCLQTNSGACPAFCITDTGVNQPGREADQASSNNAKVKTAWSHTSTPAYVFMLC
jgi:hypothetical protein